MKRKSVLQQFDTLPIKRIDSSGVVTCSRFACETQSKAQERHIHGDAIFACINTCLFSIQTSSVSTVLSPGMMMYIPAGTPHFDLCMSPKTSGWLTSVPPEFVSTLGNTPKTLCISTLVEALAHEVIKRGPIQEKNQTPAQKRLTSTFLDQLQLSEPADHLSIPLPKNPQLWNITKEIINNPADKKPIDYWAKKAGVSRSCFTRQFKKESGLSFAIWRQRVKICAALGLLSQKMSVKEIAATLGFPSTSFFIHVFKKQLGITPTQYIRNGTPLKLSLPAEEV